MNLGLKNKTALVTGGNKALGKSISLALDQEKTRLIIAAREAELARDFLSPNAGHLFFDVDLMKDTGPDELLTFIRQNNATPDIAVHNLGGAMGVRETFCDAKQWEEVWHFNLGICHELNCNLIPKMQEQQWGRVIHLSTLSTVSYEGNAAYVSAKCALDGYVKSMSKQVSSSNVIISAVAPGIIDFEGRFFNKMSKEQPDFVEKFYDNHLPIRRTATAEEVANMIVYMCSEKNSYMPGSIVRIDGGGSFTWQT